VFRGRKACCIWIFISLFTLLVYFGFVSSHIPRYTHAKIYISVGEENIISSGLSNHLSETGLVTLYTLNFHVLLNSEKIKSFLRNSPVPE